jgi:hypothetical protein
VRLRSSFLLFAILLAALPADAGRRGWIEGRSFGGPGHALGWKQFIVLPRAAEAGLAAAAADLASVLEARYGRAPQIIRTSWRRPQRAIFLGDVPAVAAALPVPEDLAAGGFVLRRRGSRLYLRGADPAGAVNAAYALARDNLGARWYWPGEIGFELVPPARAGTDEPFYRREEPAFLMRWMYPLVTDAEKAFARRNRLARTHQFNHALYKVFDREAYARAPEAFALIEGERKAPAESGKYDPQPDFTSEAAVEIAAEAALRHFAENPSSNSFPLSINDNVLFDESEATRRAVSPLRVFRDRPVYTDLVFAFMNRVARKVFDEGGAWNTPGGEPRYLTALSYYWTEAAPSFPLHPRVMPVLTSDRAQWHDPDYRAEDKALIAAWGRSGAGLVGTWDYYFGAPYPYPRQFNRWIGKSLPHLHAHGVRVFFSQLPSAWGLDGGKAWLAASLLWDPGRDWRALAGEFYRHFFGPAEAPMRRFYEKAEARRDARAGPANWIKFYKDEAGIEHFPPAFCAELRAELSRARDLAPPGTRFRERVAVVSQAFSLTEAYAACHFARRDLVALALETVNGAARPERRARLDAALADFVAARQVFDDLAAELAGKPMHHRLGSLARSSQSDPVPLGLAARQIAAMQADDEPPPLPAAVAEPVRYRQMAAASLRWAGGGAEGPPLLANPDLRWSREPPRPRSFLGPPVPAMEDWFFGFRPAPRFAIEPLAIDAGRRLGLRLSGADAVSLFTAAPVEEGGDYLLRLRCAWRVSPDNRSLLYVEWLTDEGELVGNEIPFAFPTGEEPMRELVFPLAAPRGAVWVRFSCFLSRQYPGDHLSVERADFRNLPVARASRPPPETSNAR